MTLHIDYSFNYADILNNTISILFPNIIYIKQKGNFKLLHARFAIIHPFHQLNIAVLVFIVAFK